MAITRTLHRSPWLAFLLLLDVSHSSAADPLPGSAIRLEAAALPFRFQNGSRNRHDLVEIMGGGVGLIDADGDGWLDIYLCQGGPIIPGYQGVDPACRLFRNRRDGTFEDISASAGVPGPSYAMGVAVGDFDGDGRDDLFVSGWREQKLYKNLGGGRFADVTGSAGLKSSRWGTSAAFFDMDNDGDLDLFVATYVTFDPRIAPFTAAPDGKADYPGPEDFAAEPDLLYRNNGDGTFTEVGELAGISAPDGRGLGVIAADFDQDGKVDIYVANDGTACRYFRNLGGGKFAESGEKCGLALDGRGDALAGMGVARGDIDGDGRIDVVVTNFLGRSTVLFQNEGNALFSDRSDVFGLKPATRRLLGFGVSLVDLDCDGWLDLAQANGHVLDRARLGEPFAMPTLVLRGDGRRFVDVLKSASGWTSEPRLGRGLAVGDLNNDGRPDLVVASLDKPATVLWNRGAATGGLLLDLKAAKGSAVGTRVKATVNGRKQVREVVAGGSYLTAPDRRVHIGLGHAQQVDGVEIHWISGRTESWMGLVGGRVHKLEEGSGTP